MWIVGAASVPWSYQAAGLPPPPSIGSTLKPEPSIQHRRRPVLDLYLEAQAGATGDQGQPFDDPQLGACSPRHEVVTRS